MDIGEPCQDQPTKSNSNDQIEHAFFIALISQLLPRFDPKVVAPNDPPSNFIISKVNLAILRLTFYFEHV